jgi:hypothetical protein
VNRTDALSYIAPLVSQTYESVGLTITDTPEGLKSAIDEALLMIGIPNADLAAPTVTDVQFTSLKAALRYWALDRAEWAAIPLVDGQVDGPLTNVKYSQVLKNIQLMKTKALSDLLAVGLGPSNVSFVRLTYDYFEQPRTGSVG